MKSLAFFPNLANHKVNKMRILPDRWSIQLDSFRPEGLYLDGVLESNCERWLASERIGYGCTIAYSR